MVGGRAPAFAPLMRRDFFAHEESRAFLFSAVTSIFLNLIVILALYLRYGGAVETAEQPEYPPEGEIA